MQRSPVRSGRGSLRLVRAAALAALTALAGAGLAGCSSSRPVPATGTTGLAGTVSPTLGVAVSTSEVVSAENLPVQKALSVLRELFVRSGVDPDDQHSAALRLGSCPLGRTQELTATPPAPVPALDTSAAVTLNRSRGPVLDVICRFSNDASADVTSPAQGDRTSSEVQYDASYVAPSQLKAYLRFLDDRGFVQRPERFIDGVIYASCAASRPRARWPPPRRGSPDWPRSASPRSN